MSGAARCGLRGASSESCSGGEPAAHGPRVPGSAAASSREGRRGGWQQVQCPCWWCATVVVAQILPPPGRGSSAKLTRSARCGNSVSNWRCRSCTRVRGDSASETTPLPSCACSLSALCTSALCRISMLLSGRSVVLWEGRNAGRAGLRLLLFGGIPCTNTRPFNTVPAYFAGLARCGHAPGSGSSS